MKPSSKPILIGGTVSIVAVAAFLLLRPDHSENSVKAESTTKSQTVEKSALDLERERLSRKTGVPVSLMNACVMDILAAFEAKDKDLIEQKVLEWLAKDEKLLLASIEAFDNLDNIYGYGFRFPAEKAAEALYEKHGGENLMELMASLSRVSNTVGEMTGNSMEVWGRDDLEGALTFVGENKNFDNETALIYMAEDQAGSESGDPQQMAEFLTELPADDPRRDRALEMTYGAWMENRPEEFAQFVNTLEDQRPAGNAMNSYAVHAAQHDLDAAMEWVQAMPDEDNRKTALVSVAGEMAHQDPAKYDEWLASQTFASDVERERFIAGVESMRDAIKNYVPDDSDPEEFFNSTIGLPSAYQNGD